MRDIPDIVKELRRDEQQGTIPSLSFLHSNQMTFPNIQQTERLDESHVDTQTYVDANDYQCEHNCLASSDIYKTLVELSPDGIVTVDMKGVITSCNPAAAKMSGFSSDELVGKHISNTNIFTSKDLPKIIKLFSNVIIGKNKGPFELEYHRKDGTSFWAEVHVSLIKNNKSIMGVIAISRDISERKEAEKRISQSERQYRELYEGSRDGFVLLDMNGFIHKSNTAFEEMLGYSKKELKTMKYTELIPKKWHESEAKIVKEQVLTRGYSEVYEKELIRKNKTIFPIEIRTYLIGEEGKPQGMWAVIRDVTNRKTKELELEETRIQFQQFFNASADPTVIVDRKGTFLEVSDAVLTNTGYTREELIGKSFLRTKLVTARSKTRLLANLAKRMTGIQLTPYMIDIVTKQGEVVPYEINAAKITYKGQHADMVVFRDVRERYKAQAALRESEEKFRLLSDQSLMGIAIIQGYQLEYVNQAAADITKYSCEELLKGGVDLIRKMIHPEDESLVMTQLKKKLQGDPDVIPHYSYRIITKTKETRWVDQFSKTIEFHGKKADFVTLIDVTEKKKAEEQIRRQNTQLRKMDKLKTDFLNITSHELRTPMTAMKGYLQMLTAGILGFLNEEQKNALQVILRNTNRLDQLVQDILDTSRLESGSMKFIPSKTNIKTMIDEIVNTMQLSANKKQIQIDIYLTSNLPELILDQDRVKQVFDNILNNAIKFSNEQSQIHIRALKDEDFVRFEIQDYGKGIPSDKKEKIFETFYQVDSGLDRTFGGTGLGLTISRGIILGHGGKIWVDSDIGKGSTFIFTLPIRPIQDLEGTFKKIDIFQLEIDGKIS